MPEFLQKDLYDFAWIIIINLSVALLVAYAFTPALIDQMKYGSYQQGHIRRKSRYIAFTQKWKWIYIILVVMAFGIPFHALPPKWEGHDIYNATLGSDFFQLTYKETLSQVFGGTMRLFAESLSDNTYSEENEKEVKLRIRAQMPLGGTAAELNEKVVILENFLSGFKEIKRFETRIDRWGADLQVDFKDEYQHTSFPYLLENKVIGKVISIGGADWSTYGVSERGFSNSLNLQYRANQIEIAGYNYDRLYRIAEEMCEVMKQNSRVVDLTIETPGHENQENEFYMKYDKEQMALYDFDIHAAHSTLRGILSGYDIQRYEDAHMSADMYLKSSEKDKFDLWHLQNAYLKVNGTDTKLSDFMQIEQREAKNCIPKRNQEYVLRVAFNVLGSYTYTSKYIEKITKEFNSKMPVGYRCLNASYGWYEDSGTQYWLILLIVVIIFFICAILFESFRLPLVIIMLIPVSFIGTFLTYYFSGVEFGTGGFASLVLLSGLTVNGGIYIVNEYQNICRRIGTKPTSNLIRLYVRAYNHKITAVTLTILSTVDAHYPVNGIGTDSVLD